MRNGNNPDVLSKYRLWILVTVVWAIVLICVAILGYIKKLKQQGAKAEAVHIQQSQNTQTEPFKI